MSLESIRKQAKEAGIAWRDVLAAKRDVQALHESHQAFIDEVRQTAFRKLTGRRDHMWFIFGYETDRGFGKWFSDGDYNVIPNFDTAARSVFFECPGLCSCEEDASEALYDFLRNQPFKIPCNEELYKEAFQMLSTSLAETPF
jgi:hypothetical protein